MAIFLWWLQHIHYTVSQDSFYKKMDQKEQDTTGIMLGKYIVGGLLAFGRVPAAADHRHKTAQAYMNSRAGFLEVAGFSFMLHEFLKKGSRDEVPNLDPEKLEHGEWLKDLHNMVDFLEKQHLDFCMRALHLEASLKDMVQNVDPLIHKPFSEDLFDQGTFRLEESGSDYMPSASSSADSDAPKGDKDANKRPKKVKVANMTPEEKAAHEQAKVDKRAERLAARQNAVTKDKERYVSFSLFFCVVFACQTCCVYS